MRVEQLDLEQQRGARWDDARGAVRAVAERRRDDQAALAADLHPLHALVPAANDLAGAEPEAERHAMRVGAVELAPLVPLLARVVHPAAVVDLDLLAARGGGAAAVDQVLDLQHRARVARLLD